MLYITCTSDSQMEKISPKPLQGSDVGDKPKFAFELAAVSPLQLTLTKTSLQLFKTLVDVRNPNHNCCERYFLSSYLSRVCDNRSLCLPVNNVYLVRVELQPQCLFNHIEGSFKFLSSHQRGYTNSVHYIKGLTPIHFTTSKGYTNSYLHIKGVILIHFTTSKGYTNSFHHIKGLYKFLSPHQRAIQIPFTASKGYTNSFHHIKGSYEFLSPHQSEVKIPLVFSASWTKLLTSFLHLQAYTKDYGKQVQGSVNVQALTGAPFTFVNKVCSLLD